MNILDEDIKAGQFQNVYLFYGEENYLKRQYRDKLVKALGVEGDTMNYARYEGSRIVVGEVIDLAETLPFFAKRRVIELTDTGFFASSQEELAEYLKSVPNTTCLLFVESRVDKRSKTYKAAGKAGRTIEFTLPDEKTLMRWMMGRVRGAGKTITRDAWTEFLHRTGDGMEHMDREMEKLLSYAYEKEEITLEDVKAVCTRQVQTKVFDMISFVASKNLPKVLELYHDMLAAREPALRILSLIVRQFQQMYVVKEMVSQGMNAAQMAARLSQREFIVKKNAALAKNFTMEQMRALLEDAADLEERVKQGLLNDQLAVELLIVQYSR